MSHNFMFDGNLSELDPDGHERINRENKRQRDTIILVASASDAPDSVMEAEASSFTNIIAEGYPREASRRQTQAQILDFGYELAHYRRNSDPRYYKGVEYADILEALTRRRAAELFAANTVAIWFPNAIDDLQLTSPKLAVGWNNLRLDASTDAPARWP